MIHTLLLSSKLHITERKQPIYKQALERLCSSAKLCTEPKRATAPNVSEHQSHSRSPFRPPRLEKRAGTLPSWPCSPQPHVNRSPSTVSITKWSFPAERHGR